MTTGTTADQVIASMRLKIAENLQIDPERIRYVKGTFPGQFGDSGQIRWEIHYGDQWRELPWHFDGPCCVDRALVRRWYESETQEPKRG